MEKILFLAESNTRWKWYYWYAHGQRRRIFKVTETCAECILWCLSRKCARLQFFLEQMSFRTLFRCPLVSVKHWKAQCLWNTEEYWYCKKEKNELPVFSGIAMKNILAPDWKCGEAGGCVRFFCARWKTLDVVFYFIIWMKIFIYSLCQHWKAGCGFNTIRNPQAMPVVR